jgi:hypothetical protein
LGGKGDPQELIWVVADATDPALAPVLRVNAADSLILNLEALRSSHGLSGELGVWLEASYDDEFHRISDRIYTELGLP